LAGIISFLLTWPPTAVKPRNCWKIYKAGTSVCS
jgi:hypothetical protein